MLTASSASRGSGLRSSTGPCLTGPPATFTTTSSPPKRSRAVATARRAGSGVVKSPAAASPSTPLPEAPRARSPSPPASTPPLTSGAPARANPVATACPIWPTRPTPVTSATLPRKSGGTGDDLVDRRCAALREGDRPVLAHDVHGALDPLSIVLEGVVRARDRAVRIGQQRKVESQLPNVTGVALHAGGIHAEGLDPGRLELRHLVAHGGELAVSAGRVVPRIEDERDVFRLQHVGQGVGLAVGAGRGECGCVAADCQQLAHGDSFGVSATISRDVFPRRSSNFSSP